MTAPEILQLLTVIIGGSFILAALAMFAVAALFPFLDRNNQ
jgi:hypothetical protein